MDEIDGAIRLIERSLFVAEAMDESVQRRRHRRCNEPALRRGSSVRRRHPGLRHGDRDPQRPLSQADPSGILASAPGVGKILGAQILGRLRDPGRVPIPLGSAPSVASFPASTLLASRGSTGAVEGRRCVPASGELHGRRSREANRPVPRGPIPPAHGSGGQAQQIGHLAHRGNAPSLLQMVPVPGSVGLRF